MHPMIFRGKSMFDGSWVIGDGIHYPKSVNWKGTCWIDGMREKANDWVQVDPSTVCRCIGSKDRHECLIFENDIVEFDNCVRSARYLVWWNREMSMMTAVPLDGIYFNGTDYGNVKYPQFNYDTFCLMLQDPWGDFSDIKVIGNIHDSPELMEV